jgi:DNA-binding transcriptional MocR family regulator
MANNIVWTPKLTNSKEPIYQQLANEMAKGIASGELKVGEKLPPQRQLAWHLNINLSTVTKAFQLATQRHLISGEVGKGTYVLAQSCEAQLYKLKENTKPSLINLSTHIPAFNAEDDNLANSIKYLIKKEPTLASFNQYLSPETLKRIQICAKKWLEGFNYHISSEYCIATTTAQNALLVTLLACTNKDDVILVDELTFPGIKTVAKQLKLKLYGVKMDEQGMRADSLELAIRSTGAKIIVSDPTMQNPTASSMPDIRRNEVSEIILRYNMLFIEEYVIGALSNRAPMSNTIKENSILITSFAKTVSPGVRFAVIAGNHPMIKTLSIEYHATTWQLSPLMAEIACHWIESKITVKKLKWQQTEVEKRFRLFKKVFPSFLYQGNTEITSHVWLATNKNSETVASQLHDLGVEVVPAKFFAVSHQFPHFIRVSLTAAKSHQQLKIALQIIHDANILFTQQSKMKLPFDESFTKNDLVT